MPCLPPMTGYCLNIPTIYGDDWGMVYYCWIHIDVIFTSHDWEREHTPPTNMVMTGGCYIWHRFTRLRFSHGTRGISHICFDGLPVTIHAEYQGEQIFHRDVKEMFFGILKRDIKGYTNILYQQNNIMNFGDIWITS